jgi:hypothetical protein
MLLGWAKSCTTWPEAGQIQSLELWLALALGLTLALGLAPALGLGALAAGAAPAADAAAASDADGRAAAALGAALAMGGIGSDAAGAFARICASAASEYGCFSAFGSVFSRLPEAALDAGAGAAPGAPGKGRVSTGPRAIGVVCTPMASAPGAAGDPPAAEAPMAAGDPFPGAAADGPGATGGGAVTGGGGERWTIGAGCGLAQPASTRTAATAMQRRGRAAMASPRAKPARTMVIGNRAARTLSLGRNRP